MLSSVLLALIAVACFISMIIALLVALRLRDELEQAEREIERLQRPPRRRQVRVK
jgi:uncharacterized membrane protein YciS (DUF1049 family)